MAAPTVALSPKESGEFIASRAKFVKVNPYGVEKCARKISGAVLSGRLTPRDNREYGPHPQLSESQAIDWIFLVNSLAYSSCFSYHVKEGEWSVSYDGRTCKGSFALFAGVNRAIDEGMDLTNPEIYGTLSEDDLLRIFRSETETLIPCVKERLENLREAAKVLLEKYQGSFIECVKRCKNSAQQLVKLIESDFPFYRDEAEFEGRRVSFSKRSQMLVGDIWERFKDREGEHLGKFDDIETLTLFADYRVPQALLKFEALEYSRELMKALKYGELLRKGDRMEVEIRGASIHAGELIKEKAKERLCMADFPPCSINSVMIDHFLWDYRRNHIRGKNLRLYPSHKTCYC